MTESSLEDVLRSRYLHRAAVETPSALRTRLQQIPDLDGAGSRRWSLTGWHRLRAASFRPMLVAALLLALVLATLASIGQQPSLPHAFPLGSIAFTRDGGLFVAAPDGSTIVRVADAQYCCEVGDYRFAPDGRHLAYLRPLDALQSAERLDVFDADGRAVGSYAPAGKTQFAWAPDGPRLVVVSNTPTAASDRTGPATAGLTFIGIDGHVTGSIPLPTGFRLTSYFGQTAISWSPDGRWIAVPGCLGSCDSKFDTRFLVVSSDGTGSHWLTESGTVDIALAWAPDSRRIAVAVAGQGARIFLDIRATDGTVEREVALSQNTDSQMVRIAWSPDGTQLVVLGDTDNPYALDLHGADGTTRIVPTADVSAISNARWSADGTRIVFVGTQSGVDGPGLWSIAADGSDLRSLIASVDWKAIDIAGQR